MLFVLDGLGKVVGGQGKVKGRQWKDKGRQRKDKGRQWKGQGKAAKGHGKAVERSRNGFSVVYVRPRPVLVHANVGLEGHPAQEKTHGIR